MDDIREDSIRHHRSTCGQPSLFFIISNLYVYVCYFFISTENLVVDTQHSEPAEAAVDGQETESNTSYSPPGSVKGEMDFFSNGGMRSSDEEDDRDDNNVAAVMSKCIFFSVLPLF